MVAKMKAKKKVQIEVSLLVKDGCMECAQRLQEWLSLKKGIDRVHIKGTPPTLCLHFDPNLVSLDAVERMVKELGGELSQRYAHLRLPLVYTGSADAAVSLGKALRAREGVLHANVNPATGVVSVAFDTGLTDREGLVQTIISLGFSLAELPSPLEDSESLKVEDHLGVGAHVDSQEVRVGQACSCSSPSGQAHDLHAVGPHPHHDDGHYHGHNHGHGHGSCKKEANSIGCGCGHGRGPAFLPEVLAERFTLALALMAGMFLLIGFLGDVTAFFSPQLSLGFYVLAYVAGGYDISTHALPGLLKGRFDTDILMLAAALGAAVLGKWSEGAFLLFLFALGHAGEHYALDRARSAVDSLGQLMPKTARVRRGGELLEVSVEELALNEVVVVPPGERIPVDGAVLKGRSAVDQSAITGESAPVNKEVGDEVFAGTINQENALEVLVTKLLRDNTLQRVMQMVAEAQEQKSPTQQFTQQFTARFVPLVLLTTVLVMVIPPLTGYLSWSEAFYRAMLLLVGSSPCALALGTPAAVLAGIGQAARHGVLIKGGIHLENLGRVTTLAMDKTGTLTEGRFQVTDIEPLVWQGADAGKKTPLMAREELLALTASVEKLSTHPLAAAVVNQATVEGVSLSLSEGLENLSGRGVRSSVNGQDVFVGSPRLILEKFPDSQDEPALKRASELEDQGKTVMLVVRDGELAGLLALSDEPRQEAREALLSLRRMGVKNLMMLTGDNARAAERVGALVGVTEVRAGLLPGDKVEVIREFKGQSGTIAMIGDGVNDAPALALADVGIAMGGGGTAIALETADVALMADDLSKLSFAVGLSRASRRIIQQNIAIAMGVIGLLILSSIIGSTTLGPTVVAHEGSTLVVIINALRLLRYQPEDFEVAG